MRARFFVRGRGTRQHPLSRCSTIDSVQICRHCFSGRPWSETLQLKIFGTPGYGTRRRHTCYARVVAGGRAPHRAARADRAGAVCSLRSASPSLPASEKPRFTADCTPPDPISCHVRFVEGALSFLSTNSTTIFHIVFNQADRPPAYPLRCKCFSDE